MNHKMSVTIEFQVDKRTGRQLSAIDRMRNRRIDSDTTMRDEIYKALIIAHNYFENRPDSMIFSNKGESGQAILILAVLPIFCFAMLFVWLMFGVINNDPNALQVLAWLEWAFGG